MIRRWLALALAVPSLAGSIAGAISLEEQNQRLVQQMREVHHLTDREKAEIRSIFTRPDTSGSGNSAISEHPITPSSAGRSSSRNP